MGVCPGFREKRKKEKGRNPMSMLNVISLLGGLALFLYGITLMGDGLNLVAGNKLEVVLYRLTSNRFRGILLGTLDRKSTRLNSSHPTTSRMPSSA